MGFIKQSYVELGLEEKLPEWVKQKQEAKQAEVKASDEDEVVAEDTSDKIAE